MPSLIQNTLTEDDPTITERASYNSEQIKEEGIARNDSS